MNPRKAVIVKAVVALAVIVGLPLAAHWIRRQPGSVCALDGAKIDPAYRVEIVDSEGQPHAFCCLRCAQIWLDRATTPPRTVMVTDEASGEKIDAASACYVRSTLVTMPATGNCVHVFRSRADAEKHVDEHRGAVLPDSERPLRW